MPEEERRSNANGAGGGAAHAPGEPSVAAGADGRHPLTIARGSGIIFQTAGLILAFGGCCLTSLIGLNERHSLAVLRSEAQTGTAFRAWGAFETYKKLSAGAMFATVVGGLGMLATGIAMQSDRHGSARNAVIVAAPLAVYHLCYVGYLMIRGPLRWWFPAPLLLTVVWCALGALAVLSLNAHVRHPPPKGVETIPKDEKLPGTAGEQLSRQLEREAERGDRG